MSDDAAAFTAAIGAADPQKGGPGAIFVPPINTPCRLGSAISLLSGETLYSQQNTVIIAPLLPVSDPTRKPILINIRNASNVLVSGLIFDGELQQVGTSNDLISVNNSDHIVFDHITVQNARGISIAFNGGGKGIQYSGVQSSRFSNTGMYYLQSGDKKADRKQAVIFCCGTQDANGNYINQHNFAKSNIWGQNGFDNLSIGQQSWFTASGNVLGGTHNGGNIYCSHNSHLRIVDNILKAASGNGIDCFINDDLTITGNNSTMNGAAGIQADGTRCGLIANNKTFNNYQSSTPTWPSTHPDVKGSMHRGGITIGGGLKDDTQGTENLLITKNSSGDTQSRPTQAYGIEVVKKASVQNLTIAADNNLTRNAASALGEQAANIGIAPTATLACPLWNGQ